MANEDLSRKCARCGVVKPLTEFHITHRRGREERKYHCKVCSNEERMYYHLKTEEGQRVRKHQWYCKNLDGNRMKHKEWRDAIRQKAKDYFGNTCFVCGKEVFVSKADFSIHHRDGSNDHNGHALWHPESWETCVLLCKGCHYMLHGVDRLLKNGSAFPDLLSALQGEGDPLCQ